MRIAPIVVAALLVATPAWACTNPGAISGAFQTGEKSWGEPDAQFRVEGTEAVLAPQAGTQTARWHAGVELSNADACVTITMPESASDASRG
ncbi:MAG: hypothetical protein WC829_10455, partial [Hyphomicrobium sp.]